MNHDPVEIARNVSPVLGSYCFGIATGLFLIGIQVASACPPLFVSDACATAGWGEAWAIRAAGAGALLICVGMIGEYHLDRRGELDG